MPPQERLLGLVCSIIGLLVRLLARLHKENLDDDLDEKSSDRAAEPGMKFRFVCRLWLSRWTLQNPAGALRVGVTRLALLRLCWHRPPGLQSLLLMCSAVLGCSSLQPLPKPLSSRRMPNFFALFKIVNASLPSQRCFCCFGISFLTFRAFCRLFLWMIGANACAIRMILCFE